ncbi:MAG TPA: histidine kinase dimerization/phospho-acceptor domain-containing protein, partial [Tepidisphaeraceae bacterium]|nr:histidine kinase dimerization/phospho-acceptor domain-containing protein [Tepidisphaeraceae bacterium]
MPASVVAGVFLLAAELSSLAQLVRASSFMALSGGSLILVGAAAGILNYAIIRRQSRELALQANKSLTTGKSTYLAAPENSLGPLVLALNDGFTAAEQTVASALTQVKELQIQLKVATGQRRQAQAIIYSINDAVMVTDSFDEMLLANDAAARALGFDLHAIDRKPLDEVVHDTAIVQMIRDVRASKNASEKRVVEHRMRRDGKDSIFKLTLSCITEANGEPAGVVSVFHDMTRENEISRMKNEFVSSVSHELRTPLASIRAYIEMLIDGEAQDEKTRNEFYDIIQNEANRLGRLIDNILNISRIESGLVEIKKQPLSLMVIIKEAIDVIIPQAKSKNIRIEEQLEPAFYQVTGDRDMLYQSVMNLLSNAVKYTRENGTVTVRTTVDEENQQVSVRVIDTGVGIPAKDIPFVFDKFYRVEANKNVAKGTGLGLSLVKNM